MIICITGPPKLESISTNPYKTRFGNGVCGKRNVGQGRSTLRILAISNSSRVACKTVYFNSFVFRDANSHSLVYSRDVAADAKAISELRNTEKSVIIFKTCKYSYSTAVGNAFIKTVTHVVIYVYVHSKNEPNVHVIYLNVHV